MKIILQILLLIFLMQSLSGQDKIITKKGNTLDVFVIEQTNTVFKYKMSNYPDGPVLWIRKNDVSEVIYKNGQSDQLGNQNPRKERPFGVSGGMSYFLSEEGGKLSVTADYFVLPQVDIEINVGTDFDGSYFSAGTRLHLNTASSDNRFTPFSGFLIGTDYGLGFIQIPVGINYAAKFGLNISLSLNEMLYFQNWQTTFAEMRVGWRFK